MKGKSLLFLGLAIILLSSCNSNIYKYKNFSTLRESHKTIALMPFVVAMDPQSIPTGMSPDDYKQFEKDVASYVQNYIYMQFKKKDERKKKGKYFINFQNPMQTNKMILDSNFSYENFAYFNPQALAAQTQADVVMTGLIYRSCPITNSGKYKNRIDVKISIHDKNGRLIWEFYDKDVEGSSKSVIHLAKKSMNKMIRKFPYKYKLFQKEVGMAKTY